MKKCSRCKQLKNNSEFNNSKRDTIQPYCRKCHNKYSREWRLNNSDNVKKYNKKYQKETEHNKKYQVKIKEKYGISTATIRRHGLKIALEIYEKYNRKCVECSEENGLTIHHLDGNGRNLINKGLEPNNNINNLIILCRICHGRIHGRQGRGIRKTKT